jgi:hypothetical protein
MTYRVAWRRNALTSLADIWNAGEDRRLITAAADEIDAILMGDPPNAGESREEGVRILTVSPLSVYY